MPEWIAKYWIEWAFGIIVAVLGVLIRKINARVKESISKSEATELGIQALLRERMIDNFNKYSERGYAPIYVRDSFENCYQQYHALGANGVMTDIYTKFLALPTRPPKGELNDD